LFTQCAKCETVFKLSADVLRAAGGQVRCGRCGEVFNALARLAEDATAFPSGESPLDMETRADEILHSTVVPAAGAAAPAKELEWPDAPTAPKQAKEPEDLATADIDFARLQVLELYEDDPPPAAAAPPTAKGRAESKADSKAAPKTAPKTESKTESKAVPKTVPKTGVKAAKPEAEVAAEGGTEGRLREASLEFTLPPGELDRIFVEPKPRPAPAQRAATPAVVETSESPQKRVSGFEVPEEVRREMLAGFSEAPLPEIAAPRGLNVPFAVWLCAAIVLALTLGAQMLHENRDWLAAHAPFGSHLRAAYTALGLAMPAPANLSAYQLRQWGVTGDPAANGTLRVRASILNTAAQLQPYPLLRVTLANRFGSRIGARDFEPAEYLGKPMLRMLAPGERADATLDILDPGKDAEGFEIDVCLRGADQRVVCAADAATQTQKP
jgi:predicted Zn finger-like uncharacterized protein